MYKRDEILRDIERYLSVLKYYIQIDNKLGNTDINKKSEDFFCMFLNLVYKLELQNLNKIKVNYPAIDLGDSRNRVCFQITSTSSIKKIKETLDGFKKEKLYNHYDCINIFIIGEKGNHRKKLVYKEFEFTYKENLIEINDLIKEISNKDIDELVKIKEFFECNFSKSIINTIKKLEEDKSLYREEKIIEDRHISYFICGLGAVRIDAYLPTSIEQKISCVIYFQQNGLRDCVFSFEEDFIKNVLFFNSDKGCSIEREFIKYFEGEKVGIQLNNNHFVTNKETAEQLCELTQRLYKVNLDKKEKLFGVVGSKKFIEENQGTFKLITISTKLWISMLDFAQGHDHFSGNGEWDIFKPLNLFNKNRIMIYKNHLNNIQADVLAELYVKDLNEDYVDLIWKAGYTPSLDKMEGFDNVRKWKVDFTHDWIIDEFIPYVIYLDLSRNKTFLERIIKKKSDFENFKNKFQITQYGIKSLKIKD